MKYFQLSNWANFSSGLYSLLGVTKVISKGLICGPCLKADQTRGQLAQLGSHWTKGHFCVLYWTKVFKPSSNLSNIFWCLLRWPDCHKSLERRSVPSPQSDPGNGMMFLEFKNFELWSFCAMLYLLKSSRQHSLKLKLDFKLGLKLTGVHNV